VSNKLIVSSTIFLNATDTFYTLFIIHTMKWNILIWDYTTYIPHYSINNSNNDITKYSDNHRTIIQSIILYILQPVKVMFIVKSNRA